VELVVEDLALLMAQSGLSRSEYLPLLAMAPQVAVEIQEEALRGRTRSVLEAAYCGDHRQFIRVQTIGPSLSITVATPPLKDMVTDGFHIAGKQVKWGEAGIRKQDIEPGTGYHIPEGSLAVFSGRLQGSAPMQARPKVNADRIKDWLLAISKDGHRKIASLASAAA
jgi:hypothetical protein